MAHLNVNAPAFVPGLNVNAAPFVPRPSYPEPFAWQLEVGRNVAPDPFLEVTFDLELRARRRYDGTWERVDYSLRGWGENAPTRGWDTMYVPLNLSTARR